MPTQPTHHEMGWPGAMEPDNRVEAPRWAQAGLVAAVLAVAVATLTPSAVTETLDPFCLICGERGLADVILNIVLFVPIGLALGAHPWPRLRSMAIAVGFTMAIEFAQIFIPGRDASPADVLFNSLGAALGILVIQNLSRILVPSPRIAPWLQVLAGAAVGGIIVATGVLLQPDFPRSRAYLVEWAPRIGGYERFAGEVDDVRIGDTELPEGSISDIEPIADALLRGVPLTIVGTSGRADPSLTALFSLRDRRRREIWLVEQAGANLTLALRTVAARHRLQQPELRFDDLMSAPATTPFELSIARAVPGYRATLGERSINAGFRPHDGWRLLWSPDWLPDWARQTIGVVWILGLFAPLAAWADRSIGTAAGGLFAVGSLFLTAGLHLLDGPGWIEWLGVVLATLTALVAHRLRSRWAAST